MTAGCQWFWPLLAVSSLLTRQQFAGAAARRYYKQHQHLQDAQRIDRTAIIAAGLPLLQRC